MLIFLIIFHFVSSLEQTLKIPQLSEIAAPIHRACWQLSPISRERDNYTTIICGKADSNAPTDSARRTQLNNTGLLHLMIFSAAQVSAVEAIILTFEKRSKSRRWSFVTSSMWWYLLFLVGCFLLLSSMAVRLIRIFLLMIIRRTSQRLQLRWSTVQVITVAGLCTFPFCRNTANLVALSTGWIASLATVNCRKGPLDKTSSEFSVVTEPRGIKEHAQFLLKMYLTLIPALLPYSVPHPLSIVVNLVASPVFILLALPSALLGYALPFFLPVTDFIFRLFDETIGAASEWMPAGLAPLQISVVALGLYIAFLTIVARRHEQVLI